MRETRRAITTPGRLDLSPVKKVFLGFEAEDAPGTPATYVASKREGSARYGRRAVMSRADNPIDLDLLLPPDTLKDDSPSPQSPNNPSTTPRRRSSTKIHLDPTEKSLEESWKSLSFFNRKHRGRLSRKFGVQRCLCIFYAHLWLTPFTEGKHHYVRISFNNTETISMIRIWNYNKSRIHSYRGIKNISMQLDDILIFQGEIARACGGIIGRTDSFGDTILFTTDEEILQKVSEHDDTFGSVMNEISNENLLAKQPERPLTADVSEIRPMTCPGPGAGAERKRSAITTGAVLCTDSLQINIINNWGHNSMIGLTGLQVLGETDDPVHISRVSCSDPQSNHRISRIIDGENETTDAQHMWCAQVRRLPFSLILKFDSPVHISSVIIWNYNASPELSYCGVKQVTVSVDGRDLRFEDDLSGLGELSQMSTLVRKASGHCYHTIGQLLPLIPQRIDPMAPFGPQTSYHHGEDSQEEYESPELPSGFVFEFVLLSTWGDEYYVGLNGIQMFDAHGYNIPLSKRNISAHPSCVNILQNIENDARTVDKLIDGVNDTTDGRHMWLAPILPGEINRIFVVFDKEVTVSMIKLWNYGKTPSRGVKEFGILVDDLLVYNGVLDTVGIGSGSSKQMPYRTVIFSSDKELAQRERGTLVACSQFAHDILLSPNDARATTGGSMMSADQSQRPFTSLRTSNRATFQS
ncbi:katanin-interacting protein [Nilaparvata lugens]|uniref:katanin-interacting protein n=1 Tax=Nilaparvata lugens TaxID=108931 RepID=UPI00193E3019|nr:katanin-interacting protein [Nilaparvata lugens]